ncbi:hypothetical protein SCALM49S_08351 [Streptomyces californicus]
MMHEQQQPSGLRPGVEPHRAHQVAPVGVQFRLGGPAVLLDRLAQRVGVGAGGVHSAGGRRDGARRGDGEPPLLVQGQPECVMPVEDRLERGGQTLGAEPARHDEQHRLVVAVDGTAEVAQFRHDRGGEQRSGGDVLGDRGGVVRHAGGCGDAGDGLVLEDVPWRDAQSGLAGAADQLDGDDAVAAEIEEALARVHLGQAEHLGEERGQQLFLGRARRFVATGDGRGQRVDVEAAPLGARQLGDGDVRLRHEEVGQCTGEVITKVDGAYGEAGGGHDVGDEAVRHGRVDECGVGEQGVDGAGDVDRGSVDEDRRAQAFDPAVEGVPGRGAVEDADHAVGHRSSVLVDHLVRAVPDHGAFIVGEQVDRGDPAFRLGCRGKQEPGEPRDERVDRGVVEEVGGVLGDHVHSGRSARLGEALLQAQVEIELGDAGGGFVHLDGEAGHGGCGRAEVSKVSIT